MNIIIKIITASLLYSCSVLSAFEFTISSYNCGGLTEHYDYLRAASMGQLMHERYKAEPQTMAYNHQIQRLALKILFCPNPLEKKLAQKEWRRKGFQSLFTQLTQSPLITNSPNTSWHQKANEIITSYKVRPVVISDKQVNQMLQAHISDMHHDSFNSAPQVEQLQIVRHKMAQRIFNNYLLTDILCLQEADYLDATLFPAHYLVEWSKSAHSKNGVAWDASRFQKLKLIGDVLGRGVVVQLRDLLSEKVIVVASGHITGCNPFYVDIDPLTGEKDSAKGDYEVQTIVNLLEEEEADLLIVGMDSNVTSLHPRLHILKNHGYRLDYENFIEFTCTNPYQVLDTRIDWIAIKPRGIQANIINIPVPGVGLNSLHTNISDHKPVAAKIIY